MSPRILRKERGLGLGPELEFVFENTEYGFIYGPAEVTRLFHDKDGSVVLQVKTKRRELTIRITPSGLIRSWESPVKKDSKSVPNNSADR